jgi:sugar lactone lactonase YvrE
MTWTALNPHTCELGESPFWHPQEQSLYWIDIDGRAILRANGYTGDIESWPVPAAPGCIAPATGGGLVLALRDGIYRAPQWGGTLQLLQPVAYDTATTRYNDGKCDPQGRFWAGTMYEPRDQARAILYAFDASADGHLGLRTMADGGTIANGLAWSPDQATLYWSDTTAHVIRAWDWDATHNVRMAWAATAGGLTVLRWMWRATTGSPCSRVGASSNSRPKARCWPSCRRLRCAPPCPALAAMT